MFPPRLFTTRRWFVAAPLVLAAACNVAPTAPTVTITPSEAYTLDDLTANYEGATDDNGDALQFRFTWYKDGERQVDVANEQVLRGVFTSKGEVWKVDVAAFDGKEQGEVGSAEVTILNTPPTATVEIAPASPRTDDRVRTVITKRDDDLDPTSVRYAWVLNGSPQSFEGDTLPDARTSKGDVWEVLVYADDGEEEGEPATLEFTIDNTPPEVVSARINLIAPNKYDSLACVGEGWEDVDDDPEGYQVEWLVNGTPVSTEAELDLLPLNRGDRIRCNLTAFDGDDTGNTVGSDAVILQNTPPAVTGVTIAPEEPLKNDVVTATMEGASDPDGDEISYAYEWVINGIVLGETATLPSSRFRKDDRIQLRVRPFDGEAFGDEVTSNVITAGNNPPTVDEARLAPTAPFTADIVSAEVFTSDPDADDVSVLYEWYVNGSRLSVSGAELDGASWFDKGDEIYLIVQPTDGRDTGAKVTTDTITAINSTPTKPGLKLDPTLPDGTEDALCDVTDASTDADSDTLTYTFRWTVNGGAPSSLSTTTYANDTLPASAYDEGDVLICRVTVSDGTATSPEAVAGTLLGSKERPGVDCQAILDERGTDAETGTYWIDPDDDGDISDAIEVVCDMESDGGGWTLVYYVEAEYFDGVEVNNVTRSSTAPTKLNDQSDIWDIPSDLDHTETLLGCTTQNDVSTHWWKWGNEYPYADWNSTRYTTGYVSRAASSRSSGSSTGTCYSNYTYNTSSFYGFAAVTSGSCGCANIVWGMNDYSNRTSSTGCNSTDTTRGTHTSKHRSKSIYWPICEKSQTTNGKFWIGVR